MIEIFCETCKEWVFYNIKDEIMTPDGRVYAECPICGDFIFVTGV